MTGGLYEYNMVCVRHILSYSVDLLIKDGFKLGKETHLWSTHVPKFKHDLSFDSFDII
jgi:hypothetical protein